MSELIFEVSVEYILFLFFDKIGCVYFLFTYLFFYRQKVSVESYKLGC